MKRLSAVKNFFDNMNRTVLLAIGVIIIAGLVAATFALGDTDQVAEQPDHDVAQQQQEQATDTTTGSEGEETEHEAGSEEENDASQTQATQNDSDGSNGGEAGGNDQEGSNSQAMPSQLADTGPVTPLAAAVLLGASGYFYRRSRNSLDNSRQE